MSDEGKEELTKNQEEPEPSKEDGKEPEQTKQEDVTLLLTCLRSIVLI